MGCWLATGLCRKCGHMAVALATVLASTVFSTLATPACQNVLEQVGVVKAENTVLTSWSLWPTNDMVCVLMLGLASGAHTPPSCAVIPLPGSTPQQQAQPPHLLDLRECLSLLAQHSAHVLVLQRHQQLRLGVGQHAAAGAGAHGGDQALQQAGRHQHMRMTIIRRTARIRCVKTPARLTTQQACTHCTPAVSEPAVEEWHLGAARRCGSLGGVCCGRTCVFASCRVRSM